MYDVFIMDSVGALIRLARLEADLTQAQLASRLGTDQAAISRWERGRDEPRLSTVRKVLRACGFELHLSIEPESVDRSQLRQQLRLTPDERLESVVNVTDLVASARRVG